MSNRHCKYRVGNNLRLTIYCLKDVPHLYKLWEGFHPCNRKMFPYGVVDTVLRSKRIARYVVFGTPLKEKD